jgi:hypothetical protein
LIAGLLACLALGLALGPGRAVAQPTLAPPAVLAGPDGGILALSGMSIARDGTGGLVYLTQASGTAHVFVSRLAGGSFQPPQEVDASLAGASSQPVIAAANGGVLLIAFINGGNLYAVNRASSTASFTAPIGLSAGAANPAISMSTFGKAYLAFTASVAGGHDVRSAFYYLGRWALEPTPLDVVAGDDAGAGTGRPAVATAGDGVAIVVWGEAGHIISRRVWGISPSQAYQEADVPSLSGWNEVSADQPSVSAGGDSSYADVGFREVLSNGAQTQSRALMRRLVAGSYLGPVEADGLATPGPESAGSAQVLMGEYGRGYMTSARASSNALFADVLGTNGVSNGVLRVDSLPNASPPYAVPATAGLSSLLIAWQQAPSLATAEIRVRYATGGGALGPELVASSPSLGPASAARGLAAGGDVNGDAALAWVQGAGASTRIVTAQMYQLPGSFAVPEQTTYSRSPEPTLSWSVANEAWGPVLYQVTVDGVLVARTPATTYRPATPLSEGPHAYQVTADNPAGLGRPASPATVVIDTVAPSARVSLSGTRRAGSPVRVAVRYSDVRPPEPAADSSGVATVRISWGDGTSSAIGHGQAHVYPRPALYKLTVTVADRAGNATTVVHYLRIVAARGRR